ncbi:hypothetical protein MRB53_009129 [Persea americana]|uniref:Uncharacterized protein n=1 Tax=Persea americana TaxID=3435 RepID=A0ACC2LP59_PERAE|nr:hypothetical protein MRB53_009129 [Persea americana]
MAQSWEDLPEELWKAIFDCIKPTEYHHLESISLVCKRLQLFSDPLVSTLNVSILAPVDRDISPVFRRFHHLKRINFSASLSKVSVKNIVIAISRSDLRLTALDLSNQERFSYFAIHDLGRKMKDTMRTLICARMGFLNDQDLYQIAASFPDLEELDISYPSSPSGEGVSNKGISGIAAKLQKLRSINISGNSFISDVSLRKLSSLSSLSEISAQSCSRLTISGINYVIQYCNNLCSLSVSINPISSSNIESFCSNARNLQCLNLSGKGIYVSDELLSVIGNHNLVLRKLVLSECHGFTFDGLSAVVLGQQSLQHLDLEAIDFLTDEMMSSLSEHLPHVFSIDLDWCTHLTSSTIFNLAKNCPSLEEISMSHTSLGLGGEDSVSELGKNCKIRSLKLRHNKNLRDETLERIGTLCPELRSLDVSYCWSVTGVGIGGIGKYCTKITELRIDECGQVRNLGSDSQFSKLEVLMAYASGIEDEGLEMIGRGCQRLRILHMKDCVRVTEKGIRELLKSCKVLRKLNLKCCCDLSADFFAWMMSSGPSLRTIVLSYGQLPTKELRDLLLRHGILFISGE